MEILRIQKEIPLQDEQAASDAKQMLIKIRTQNAYKRTDRSQGNATYGFIFLMLA